MYNIGWQEKTLLTWSHIWLLLSSLIQTGNSLNQL